MKRNKKVRNRFMKKIFQSARAKEGEE